MLVDDDFLMHFGILRKSGRYPWGSGETVEARSRSFLDHVEDLKRKGFSDVEIAEYLDIGKTTNLRALKTIAGNAVKQQDISTAVRLKEKSMSNVAIGKQMGIGESQVRRLLAASEKQKEDILTATADMLRREVAKKEFLDVGVGNENQLGISQTKLRAAVTVLQEEGYTVHTVQVPQAGTQNKTLVKVLTTEGHTYGDVKKNMHKIQTIEEHSVDGGNTYLGIKPPLSISLDRVGVTYGKDGGSEHDGLIYVRPGVKDVSLGRNSYAQVRVAVNGTHYLKGMAVYKDDLPKGKDIVFNTNKNFTGNHLDAMKPMKDDPDNPFGTAIKPKGQILEIDKDGKERVSSAMNMVNEAGDWDKWSRTLSAQMLSKQNPKLAKQQLDMQYEKKRKELDEIKALNNPVIKQKLLQSFAEDADASAVHLDAAGLPRSSYHVLIPVKSVKPTEVYAPNYRDGEQVVLIRFPHGGIFEIPELTVNNRNPDAKKILGQARDAIGINAKVAQKLSGADFDGDAVIVIPNGTGAVKTAPSLEKLKDFDPKTTYKKYEGMEVMSEAQTGTEMGKITNLIADMSIRGAKPDELARAVRHSMVVIDANKHELNYKQSAIDNGITALKTKYQGGPTAGASTLITKAGSEIRVPEKKLRKHSQGGPIDPATGKLVWVPTNETYTKTTKTGLVKTKPVEMKTNPMAETDNAFTLSSGTAIESVYAQHANNMKALANEARKTFVETPPLRYDKTARKVYAKEVASLDAKLNIALKNAPRERKAQILAYTVTSMKKEQNPEMSYAQYKKVAGQALYEARNRTGAGKQRIYITDEEWTAIQAGAVSHGKLESILANANTDRFRDLATPKAKVTMTPLKLGRAQSMLNSGYSQADVADALGVSVSTLKQALG